MIVLQMEKAAKHQELMREKIQELDFQTMTEWLNDYSWVELQEMALAAMREGDGADFGLLMMKVINYAAARETEQDVEKWAEDVENEEVGQFCRNASIGPRQKERVWLNPVIRGI